MRTATGHPCAARSGFKFWVICICDNQRNILKWIPSSKKAHKTRQIIEKVNPYTGSKNVRVTVPLSKNNANTPSKTLAWADTQSGVGTNKV